MELRLKCILTVWLLVVTSHLTSSTQEVIRDMSKGFVKAFDLCLNELSIQDRNMIAHNFNEFWHEDFVLTDYSVGCMIDCLSKKLEIMDAESSLQHDTSKDFAMRHGADESTAHRLVEIFHSCNDMSTADVCERSVNTAMCFKKHMHDLAWAPEPEVLIEIMLFEI